MGECDGWNYYERCMLSKSYSSDTFLIKSVCYGSLHIVVEAHNQFISTLCVDKGLLTRCFT